MPPALTSMALESSCCWATALHPEWHGSFGRHGKHACQKRDRTTLVTFLRIDAASTENCLLFITSLDFTKEIFDLRVLFQVDENAIHL